MTATQTGASPSPTWAQAIAHPAQEFPLAPLPVLAGAVPIGLHGSLYRNGPGRLERGGQRVGHWFDGDGAILAVHFAGGQARATYRYVQTAGSQAEAKADRWLYGNYGMVTPGPWWQRWGKPPKNVANTSVLALPDRLLALWEGGLPHALDLETLATQGLAELDGLGARLPYSAHPKRDAATGDIYNFGVTFGQEATLHLYRSDRHGQLLRRSAFKLQALSLIHDFVLAGEYLIFCVPPLRLNPLPLLLNLQSYGDALKWQPQCGTEILVFDRQSLELVSRCETEPWFQWHFGNGASDREGNVTVHLCRYADFRTNQFLKEVATGQTHTAAFSTLWELCLNPKTGKVLTNQPLLDRSAEFPTVAPAWVGQAARYTYLSVRRDDAAIAEELLGAIARYDHQTQALAVADLGAHRYAVEPLFVPKPDAASSESGWVLTVVFDGDRGSSEVWIFESDGLTDGPIARLALPRVVPIGFHGTWRPHP
jgi:all-trans-8'-apo-beta-carotenal 15,15'-oxygenase